MKKDKKYIKDLRSYIATVTIGTMLSSFIICWIISFSTAYLILDGRITSKILAALCTVVFILSISLSTYLIWIGTGHLTKPLLEISEVAKKIADGNFTVRVKRKKEEYEGYVYTNELDELARNINKMVGELEGMDYMRKDFMSNVSHEIKTPIAAISGLSELLLDEKIPKEKQREYLNIINDESMRVSRLCEYMLNMSRLDSQIIVVNKNEIQLDEQIRKCVILLCEKWNNVDIDFDIDLKPISIKSDGDMLHQVWINIIENSIKYSDKSCRIIMLSGTQKLSDLLSVLWWSF